ncbi:hypothetical protein TNCV_448461 [Trichonephila clavipes]|nr:hypothetical protein TNCV_448461 [Trichonephila clavipes]
MGDFTYDENADMHYMYVHANVSGRAALRMYYAQSSDCRMPNRIIFQRLHCKLRKTRSFHVTRHDAGRRRAVPSPSLEESILNVGAVKPEPSTRAVAYYISLSH